MFRNPEKLLIANAHVRNRAREHICLPIIYRIMVGFAAFFYLDLLSAFVHGFLDNCNHELPMIGRYCAGTQFHHHEPRSQSQESILHWVGGMVGTVPGIVFVGLYGFVGSIYRLSADSLDDDITPLTSCYPRWFQFFILLVTLLAPLSYVFHQAAHVPEKERFWLWTLLQRWHIALSPQLHKMHHLEPNMTWSVLSGYMDWLPNLLQDTFGVASTSRVMFIACCTLVFAPWCTILAYLSMTARCVQRRCGKHGE